MWSRPWNRSQIHSNCSRTKYAKSIFGRPSRTQPRSLHVTVWRSEKTVQVSPKLAIILLSNLGRQVRKVSWESAACLRIVAYSSPRCLVKPRPYRSIQLRSALESWPGELRLGEPHLGHCRFWSFFYKKEIQPHFNMTPVQLLNNVHWLWTVVTI